MKASLEFSEDIDLAIHEFSEYLAHCNHAYNTIHVYTYAVRQFYEQYHEITDNHLQLYKLYLLEHYKPRTVNLRIRAMNCYLEYRKAEFQRIGMVRLQQKGFLENVISQGDYEYFKN